MNRNRLKHSFLSVLLGASLASCTQGNLDMLGMFYTKSELADERFEQSEEWNATHPFDTVRVSAEQYQVYCLSDVHTDFSTTNLDTFCAHFIEETKQQDCAPFCICLGDIINAVGHFELFESRVDALAEKGLKMYCTPGNHDIYYDQWQEYRSYWGSSHFCVVVKTPSGKKDLYIFIDSSSATLGDLQTTWLTDILKEADQQQYRHIVVNTHTHFWKKDQSQGHTSNFALEETYELADLFSRYGVELVMQGHSHSRDLQQFKGVSYLRIDAIEDHYYNAAYTVLTIGEGDAANKGISWRHVPVGPQDPTHPTRPID